jgi:hypothetical protein
VEFKSDRLVSNIQALRRERSLRVVNPDLFRRFRQIT